jgi:hypothetical protein
VIRVIGQDQRNEWVGPKQKTKERRAGHSSTLVDDSHMKYGASEHQVFENAVRVRMG